MTQTIRAPYLPKSTDERAALREILKCHERHHGIIRERTKLRTERARRKGKAPGRVWLDSILRTFSHRTLEAWVRLRELGIDVPIASLHQYPISLEEFERCQTPPKYRIRPYNILREKLRLAVFAPEVFQKTHFNILDLSAGACAAHEILPDFGHKVTFADYWNQSSTQSPFHPFWNHYGIQPTCFDGQILPMPFKDAEYDLVLCAQAINFYAPQAHYLPYIKEICRFSRHKVIIIFNASKNDTSGKRELNIPDLSSLTDWTWETSRCPETHLPSLVLTKL